MAELGFFCLFVLLFGVVLLFGCFVVLFFFLLCRAFRYHSAKQFSAWLYDKGLFINLVVLTRKLLYFVCGCMTFGETKWCWHSHLYIMCTDIVIENYVTNNVSFSLSPAIAVFACQLECSLCFYFYSQENSEVTSFSKSSTSSWRTKKLRMSEILYHKINTF